MANLADHKIEFWVLFAMLGLVTIIGFAAARWRPPQTIHSLEEWGLGGRAFGNWVTFFLLSGDIYSAYTFVALPTVVYGVGAAGFFPAPMVVVYPIFFVALSRFWSVSHVHGFVTSAEFVRARFGSRTLSLGVAVTGIVATMPYIALQMVGIEAVFRVIGLPSGWPLAIAFGVLAIYTYNSGLRAPALIAIVKNLLVIWAMVMALLVVATRLGGWHVIMNFAQQKFAATPTKSDGLLLNPSSQLNYVTLALGSAMALFLYPHTLTGALAARNRSTLRRSIVAMPVFSLTLGVLTLVGLVAIADGLSPVGGDRNSIIPLWFHLNLPGWMAGLAFAAIGVGAMVPAAIMSIAAANLFTRDIYREYIRPQATAREEARVGKIVSLTVKLGALVALLALNTQFAIDLQLIGGVFIMQTFPAVALGLYTRWFHRWALIAGLGAGLLTGLVMLYQIPQYGGPKGTTMVRAHFGGSAWPLSHLGLHTTSTIYVGIVALAANLVLAAVLTPVLRTLRVPDGIDRTAPTDYAADEGDQKVRRMTEEIIDGAPQTPRLEPLHRAGDRVL